MDRINQLFYKNCILDVIKDIFHAIRKSENKSSHDGNGSQSEALFILKKSFQLARWFYETYENEYIQTTEYELPKDDQKFSLDKLNAELERLSKQVVDYQAKVAAINATPELVVERQKRDIVNANNIGKSEAETRAIIDDQLRESVWECNTETINFKIKKSLPEKGKNKAIAEWYCNGKCADYALFVGTKLYGIVEAKKFANYISTNSNQSKMYAEQL